MKGKPSHAETALSQGLIALSSSAIVAYEDLDCEAVGSAHGDPLDRLLVAQSKVSDMLLLTHDELLGLYGEPHVIVV
ncbi:MULTISPECIES: type II toxin-antitoxin system VapC family toxin [unclassified Adlercreutzia]|uniref:type II toxin-antitoxin system VapC family toxin n=1 Tax=unclassified Adlercreutzia TaxID=2636013 RepID=UPI0013EA7958|nr:MULTISPECIES: type II toxin-antitoxin system VapC family toxin [unclassified Adlercreutzia]